jgi:hypothetical protein
LSAWIASLPESPSGPVPEQRSPSWSERSTVVPPARAEPVLTGGDRFSSTQPNDSCALHGFQMRGEESDSGSAIGPVDPRRAGVALGVQDEGLDRQAIDLRVGGAEERAHLAARDLLDRLTELPDRGVLEEHPRLA